MLATSRRPPEVDMGQQWGAILLGVVWGLATLILLASLFLALAYAADSQNIANNIEWYLAGSAGFAMLVGGFVAGWGSAAGAMGWVPGMTVWGVMLVASVLIGIPAVLGTAVSNPIGQITGVSPGTAESVTWSGFTAALVGLLLAVVGGLMGGIAGQSMLRDAIVDEDVEIDRERDERMTRRSRMQVVPPHTHDVQTGVLTEEEEEMGGYRRSGTDL